SLLLALVLVAIFGPSIGNAALALTFVALPHYVRLTRAAVLVEITILVDVPANAKVSKEETFGPLAPLFRFKDEADVIAQANDTEFGLAAYFYARDLSRVFRVGEALEYGIVGINTGIISNEVAPFGGIKASGLGREGSKYGIEDYLEIKYMCIGL
ncbi:aldehyde dehydrogenase family protein, partial [Escherichia coli]